MKHRHHHGIGSPIIRAGAMVLLMGSLVLAQNAFKPVATVQELMERVITPTSDMVFGAAAEAPSDSEGWRTLGNSALMLAESGNILLIDAPDGGKGAWTEQSKALRVAAAAAFKAANDRNADALAAAGDQIYETCAGCHEQYMK
jgi:hypothetical protein